MTLVSLAERHCIPCNVGIPPLKGAELKSFSAQLPGWKVIKRHHLEKTFLFKDFKEALAFTNKVGALAEKAGHHPDILLSWGKVIITLWTHKINGLAEADFVFAAKVNTL